VAPFRRLIVLTTLVFLLAIAGIADDSARFYSTTSTYKGEVQRWDITGPWGGDVRSLVVAPDNPDSLYLGTTDGQIFRSSDGAQTWRRLRPGIERRGLSVDNIVIDPRNTRVIYAGTWAVASGAGDQGVFKSEDGGEHWQLLKDTRGLSVLALAVAPSDSSLLIAGAKSGVFRSTDSGSSWQRVTPEGDAELRNVESIAIDPKDTNTIYIGTFHLPWKTTDGGKNWKQTGYKETGMIDDTDIFGISVNPLNPDLVYINGCSGIYRSTTGGEKWFKIPGIPFSARRTYVLLPHPSNPSVIFAGTSEGLWRTKDGGKRWMLLTSKSAVVRAISIHPDKPNRVLIGTDDHGIKISENLGDSFVDTNVGFINRHVLAILPDASDRGRVLSSVFHDGSAGSVFASTDGGESWQPSSAGLGARDVFAFYQLGEKSDVVYAGTNSGVFRSDDRGSHWSFIGIQKPLDEKPVKKVPSKKKRASLPLAKGAIAKTGTGNSKYKLVAASQKGVSSSKKQSAKSRSQPARRAPNRKPAPEIVQPVGPPLIQLTRQVDDITAFTDREGRPGLLAATMDGLYRTFDESSGWEKVFIDGYDVGGRVYSVSTHRDTPLRIFVGTKQGLFVSNNGGENWERNERGPTEVIVNAIAQDPRSPDLVLLATNQSVFRSTNGGRTWVRRGGGLPNGDYTSIVINPGNPDEVLVAEYSHGGVYRSTDKGYMWDRIDELTAIRLPTSRVWTLTFDPFDADRVYAGSFSSGVYILTIQRGASTRNK
jgi:photosystem II stability/assembly factor-like uncharacterized protein